MSTFLNTSVIVLATMVIVLAGMVGYVYFQQNKLINAVHNLSSFVGSQFVPPIEADEEEDDRASIEEEKQVEVVEKVEVPVVEPEKDDVDDLQNKTSAELRELLSKKGLPYGKRDSKTTLLQLLKASA